jgi:putative transposase
MPRRPRFSSGGYLFHVLNRAVGRQTLFTRDEDYFAFQRILEEARGMARTRLLAYVIMPNHWHLILWPPEGDDLSTTMHWLTGTHTQRWHAAHGTSGTGPLYQGRFKSFPIQSDEHFLTVVRYVERNPLRANLVTKAENWRFSSLWQWHASRADVTLDEWPLPRPAEWLYYVNSCQSEAEVHAVRNSIRRGTPLGDAGWRRMTAERLGLESTLRLRGRPRF